MLMDLILEAKILTFSSQPLYQWSSGMLAPIYCDNRKIISNLTLRNMVSKGLADIISEKFPSTDIICATSTAAIPHAAWVANIMELPLLYGRKKPKEYGLCKKIEGDSLMGTKCVIVDDVITTGKSAYNVISSLPRNLTPVGVVSILDYKLRHTPNYLKENSIPYDSLIYFPDLLTHIKYRKYFTGEEILQLEKWYAGI